MQPVHIYKL